jgi:hypothetical protein
VIRYIVYKRTSPSGNSYVGYTKLELMERWRECIKDLSHSPHLPLAKAIKKYGHDNWIHEILFETYDKELACSKEIEYIRLYGYYNIAPGGSGGLIGTGQLGKHWKISDTSNMRGKKTKTNKVIEGYKQISGKNNYQFRGFIKTPWGIFESAKSAVMSALKIRNEGASDIITDGSTLRKYIRNLDSPLNANGRKTPPEWRGKSPREIGFDILGDSDVWN